VRREYLDRTLFWNQRDLERKLENHKPITTNTGVTAAWPELRWLNGAAYLYHQSQNLSHIPGGNIAKAYFRPQLPPELEFDTDTSTRPMLRRLTATRSTLNKLTDRMAAPRRLLTGATSLCDRNVHRVRLDRRRRHHRGFL
jgi:hypothetical protein